MSFISARITTTLGLNEITSCRNRTSICWCGLPFYAAIQIWLSGKEFRVALSPAFRDLVAQKNDAIFAGPRFREFGVLAAVANQPGPISPLTPLSFDPVF
jgi:hypothetical protein